MAGVDFTAKNGSLGVTLLLEDFQSVGVLLRIMASLKSDKNPCVGLILKIVKLKQIRALDEVLAEFGVIEVNFLGFCSHGREPFFSPFGDQVIDHLNGTVSDNTAECQLVHILTGLSHMEGVSLWLHLRVSLIIRVLNLMSIHCSDNLGYGDFFALSINLNLLWYNLLCGSHDRYVVVVSLKRRAFEARTRSCKRDLFISHI